MTKRYLLIFLGIVLTIFLIKPDAALAQAPQTDELAILSKDLEDLERALEKSTLFDEEIETAGRLGAEIRRP